MGPGEGVYLRAFRELSTTRQFGMGIGPIPWDRILLYAQWQGLDPDLTEALTVIIRCMDDVYLEWHAKDQERKRKKTDD